ncbi:MAG: glycogen/starch synthase [candidate division KSB1 bacterium]|nr:glycogen/starch synthase [candidate division KSB1 bacterium]MDZ7319355.1 glycogen/starch synthase [candidate division KSB1 bacterium]MDZ7340761.1 glycogen/starch synthase [candidate division KSB1 bacterium]
MKLELTNWKKDWTLMSAFFSAEEIEKIKSALQKVKVKTVVYCSLENRFAKAGGLAAVTMKILPYLKEANRLPQVLLVSPFYPHIMDESKLQSTGLIFDVPFAQRQVKVELLAYTFSYQEPKAGQVTEYYLKANDFFGAHNRLNDPYLYYEHDRLRNDEAIRENALFFCRAVPLAMRALGIDEHLIFHVQDWQTALIGLTAKEAMMEGHLKSCGVVQTLHNAFDAFIPWQLLAEIITPGRSQKFASQYHDGLTALQLGLPLMDGPITTVSENFAQEFTTDIMQTAHFAPHLQTIFKRTGVYGINNGMFVNFPPEFSDRKNLTLQQIRKIKTEKRTALLTILDEYHPPERFGELTYRGQSITHLPETIPIFVMSGRLDYNQKGYDIFLQAIERFAQDELKVILTPMPIKASDLDYFHEVAEKCRGNVTVFPIRMAKGFQELQIGSTFGVMPSLYEPFGAAVEYMVNGTITIARKTGGLADQIDHRQNGLLFREPPTEYNLTNIKQLTDAADNVHKRKENRWNQSMVDALHEVMQEAIILYQNHRNEYYRQIIMGFKKAKNFNWSTSAQQYFEVYKKVNQGF